MSSCFCFSGSSIKEDGIEQQGMPSIIPMVMQHSVEREREPPAPATSVHEAPPPPLPPPPPPLPNGLSLRYLSELAKSLPSEQHWTFRKVVEQVVLPATATRRCAFVETLRDNAIGKATYYAAVCWESPFSATVEAIREAICSGDNDIYILISVFVFSLWSGVGTLSTSDFPRNSSTSSSQGSGSKNGITSTPLMMDAEHFVKQIEHTLITSQARLTLVLCLDELFIGLGRMLIMHAAWNAVRGGVKIEIVPFNTTPGRLSWPRQIERCPTTGAAFRLLTADAPDARVRDALINNMKAALSINNQTSTEAPVTLHSSGPTEPNTSNVDSNLVITLSAAGLTQTSQPKWKRNRDAIEKHTFEHRMEMERRRLWQALVLAATTIDDQKAPKTQRIVKAVFLSMDGRYYESKATLLGILNKGYDLDAEERAHVLTLLAEVRLHMGQPLHAHNHALEALHLLNDTTMQPLVSAASTLPSFPSLLLSRSTTIEGAVDYGRSATAPQYLPNLPSRPSHASGRPTRHLDENVQWGRTCLARSLELLNQAGQAEDIYRQMFILLDQQEGPRAARTLRLMSCLGRNLSFFQGRHEEGAILLRECLKSAKHAVNVWTPRQQILVTRIARADRSFSSPERSESSIRNSHGSSGQDQGVLGHTLGHATLRMLRMKVSVLSCDIASAFSHMTREEKREWKDHGIVCHGGGGGAPMSCSMTIITSFRAAAANKEAVKSRAGNKFLAQTKTYSSDIADLIVVDSSHQGLFGRTSKLRSNPAISRSSNAPTSRENNSLMLNSTLSTTEEVLLFDQACCFMEAACGMEHESSCLVRARAAAGAIAVSPVVRSSIENAAEMLEKDSSNRYVSSFTHSDPQVALLSCLKSAAGPQQSTVGPPWPTALALEAIEAIRFEAESLSECIGSHHAYALDVRTVLAEALESQLLHQSAVEEWKVIVAGRRAQCDLAASDLEEREGSVLTASALTQLAHCLSQLGKLQEASLMLIEAAAEFTSATGALGIQTGQALAQAAEAQTLIGDHSGAERSLSEAVEAYELKYGRNNWRTKEVRMAWVESIEAQGRIEEAERLMVEFRLKKSMYGREEYASWRINRH